MEYASGNIGRVLWARFDHGEDLTAGLLDLTRRERVARATILVLGALGQAEIVVGPREPVLPPDPIWSGFTDGREILGIGTLAPGPEGPALHLHLAAGRGQEPVLVGCLRRESQIYLTVEALVLELNLPQARRHPDQASGLNLISFE